MQGHYGCDADHKMADSGERAHATRPSMTKEASRWRAEPCRSFRIDLGNHFPRTRLLRRSNAKPSIGAANHLRGGRLAAICIVFALMLPDAVVSAAAQAQASQHRYFLWAAQEFRRTGAS
jgi:hypothetical protein